MNLNQHIKSILKEWSSIGNIPQTRITKLIKTATEDYVTFKICKLSVIDLNEKDYVVIIITEKPIRSESKDELQRHLNDTLPFRVLLVIEAGSFGCRKQMNENVVNLTTSYMKYDKLISNLVNEIVGDHICGLNWEIFKLPYREGIQIRIILYVKTTKWVDFETYEKQKRELQNITNEFLPIFERVFITTDTTKCGEELNESEITERCWKGYSQKGMKTMFGKRYPNCVKIKKKKSVRESIKDILDEEVIKKYPKPSEKIDKLVYRWLDEYFKGSKMYYNKSYESTHSFEWCNNGNEICNLRLYFNNNDNVYDDKRPMSERALEVADLSIPTDIVDELFQDIPIRRNYLRYLIEEWFEDNLLSEVQQKIGRNDIYVTEFTEYPKKSMVCVPPVEKPENVSMDDMIEYVLANTLFRREELFNYEEEQPGYIEKTYLNKLRQKEHERLNG